MENGIRALWFGSKPHSNGDDFSRLIVIRMDTIHAIENTINGRIIATIDESSNKIIY